MRLALITALILTGTLALAQEALPGLDLIGSDRALQRGDRGEMIVNSPDVNAQIGGYEGQSDGKVATPGLSNAGIDNRSNMQNRSEAEASSQVLGTANRVAGEVRAQRGQVQSNDNGSVWNSNVTRQSNVVAQTSQGTTGTTTEKPQRR